MTLHFPTLTEGQVDLISKEVLGGPLKLSATQLWEQVQEQVELLEALNLKLLSRPPLSRPAIDEQQPHSSSP